MRKAVLCAVLLAVLCSPVFAANLLLNGDFSTGDLTGWTQWTQRGSNTLFTVENGQGKFWGAGFNGGIWQTFTTVPGVSYVVSGWGKYAASTLNNQSTWSEILVGSSTPAAGQDYNGSMSGVLLCAKQTTNSSAMVFWDKQFAQWDGVTPVLQFTAATATTTIVLKHGNSTGSTRTGMFVDDVVVRAVPEPTSLLALGTGLFGLCGMIRRKR